MKHTNKILLTTLVSIILQCGSSMAQPSYNSALAEIPNIVNTVGIVRAYSPNFMVTCYYDNTPSIKSYFLIMNNVMTTASSQAIKLSNMEIVTDMRIFNGYVYFCGADNNSNACYGFVDISDFRWSPPIPPTTNVEYRELGVPANRSRLTKMQVYFDGADERLVAIGTEYIPPAGSSSLIPATTTNSYALHRDYEYFLVECANPRNPSPVMNYLLVNWDNNDERPTDMVLTNSYLAVVGFDETNYTPVYIHKCQKNDVINTFNNRYLYAVQACISNPGPACCAMDPDVIAIANLTCDPYNYYNGITTHVVKLQSMTNTSHQEFKTSDKTDLYEMVYYPANQELVMLTHYIFLPTSTIDDHVFLRMKPYLSVPYMALGVVEDFINEYRSIDKLGTDFFVATNGGYGFVKHALAESTPPSCYKIDTWPIQVNDPVTIIPDTPVYDKDIMTVNRRPLSDPYNTPSINLPCLQY